MLLTGKRVLVTGVLNCASIAFAVAQRAQAEGAEIVLTSFGPVMKRTIRAAKELDPVPDVLSLDVCSNDDLEQLQHDLRTCWGGVDGVLHSIAYAPRSCLGSGFMDAPWGDVAEAMHVSAFSLKALAAAVAPLMPAGSSIVGLDFDADRAWPVYEWMGVAKSSLEAVSRYLARELGERQIRVNLVSCGPLHTFAARSIPHYRTFAPLWHLRAPLGWDTRDPGPAAKACVALFSDLFPATTGEIVHVDGGAHAVGVGREFEYFGQMDDTDMHSLTGKP